MITGASSYTGARVYLDLKREFDTPAQPVCGTYHNNKLFPELQQLDLSEERRIREFVHSLQPDWIVHIAAIPSQANCEKDVGYARRVNVDSVRTLVAAANKCNAKLIFLSSESSYEDTLYGQLKKEGEEIAKTTEAGWIILQPAMIFGLSPNTVSDRPYNRLLRAIEKNQAAEFDADLKFFPTYLGNLSEVCCAIIERNISNETVPVCSERLCSRAEVARAVLEPFGIEVIETHSGKSGSNAPLTQASLKRLELPNYSASEALEKIANETLAYFSARGTKI